MLCSGEQTVWAGLLLESLDDVVTPTGSVVTWLRSNLGSLNLRLQTEFAISGSGYCIVPEMSQTVSGIYTEMYYCAYFSKQANKNLGAAGYDWVSIEGEDQGSIKKVSRNDISKSFRALAKDCRENLAELTRWYGENVSPVSPSQVLYGSRIGGTFYDLLPPPECISACNPIWNS